MHFLIKAKIPIEAGNELMKNPKFGKIMDSIIGEIKPKSVYFTIEKGHRTILMMVHCKEAHELPKYAEPLWLGLHADVHFLPLMDQNDFNKAQPHIQNAVKKYGTKSSK